MLSAISALVKERTSQDEQIDQLEGCHDETVEQEPGRPLTYSATAARSMSLSVTRSSDRIDDKHLLVMGIDGCKHLIPRSWICAAVTKATALAPLSDPLLDVIKLT